MALPSDSAPTPDAADFSTRSVVPVLAETLAVGKTWSDRGGYRVTKHVEERDERASLQLARYSAVVERRPVGRMLAAGETCEARLEGDLYVIPVLEEILVTEKRVVLVEEIRVSVSRTEVEHNVVARLRREAVDIERIHPESPASGPGSTTPGTTPIPGRGPTRKIDIMNSVLVGIFETQSAAQAARAQLLNAGFDASALSLTGDTGEAGSSGGVDVSDEKEGAIAHFFKKMFGADDDRSESDTYQEAFRRGHYGLSVTTTSEAESDRAEEALNGAGAIDIDEKAQGWRDDGWKGSAVEQPVAQSTGAGTDGQVLKEVEEELKVGKRSVSRGGVRIFTRTVETPVQESVVLREQHADIQRRTVDRPATAADMAAFQDASFEVRESAEEAVVSKTARVVGEVEIGTRITERDEVIEDTVRKTSVDVERIGEGQSLGAQGTRLVDDKVAATAHSADAGSLNRDPITGEPGAHPIGTGVGAAAGGMAAGAAAGTVVGPVGTVVGAAVGAVAGGLAGKGVAEQIDPTDKGADRS